jgi:hypothetical protein
MRMGDSGVDSEALKHIGAFLGIADLAFDAEGLCLLDVDDRHALIVRRDAEHRRVIVMIEIGKLDDSIEPEVYRSLLELNLLQTLEPGPGLGLEPASKRLFLFRCIPYADADVSTIHQLMTGLFECYGSCVEQIQGNGSDAPASEVGGSTSPVNFA